MRKLIITISLLYSVSVFSQVLPEVDISLRYEIFPANFVALGQPLTIRYNVTNLSTTRPAIGEILFIPAIPANINPADFFAPSGQLGKCPTCLASELCLETEVIPPGETRFCELFFVARDFQSRPVRARARLQHLLGTATDPNLTNNTDQVTIGILPPTPVQVPLSPLSYGLMSVLMLGLGGLVARKG